MAGFSIERGTVQVFDDILPTNLYGELLGAGLRTKWQYGWRSANAGARYWHHEIARGGKTNTQDVSQLVLKHPFPVFSRYVDWIRSEVMPSDARLLRLYLNGHTFGTDGSSHTDTERQGEVTSILFLNPSWMPDFGGETVVFDAAGDIEKAVIPRPNRLLTFPSDRLHGPRPLSKLFGGLRIVLVGKFGLEGSD